LCRVCCWWSGVRNGIPRRSRGANLVSCGCRYTTRYTYQTYHSDAVHVHFCWPISYWQFVMPRFLLSCQVVGQSDIAASLSIKATQLSHQKANPQAQHRSMLERGPQGKLSLIQSLCTHLVDPQAHHKAHRNIPQLTYMLRNGDRAAPRTPPPSSHAAHRLPPSTPQTP